MFRVLILVAVFASLFPTTALADGGGRGIVQNNQRCTGNISFFTDHRSNDVTIVTVKGAWWLSVQADPKWEQETFDKEKLEIFLVFHSSRAVISVYASSLEGAEKCTTYEFDRLGSRPEIRMASCSISQNTLFIWGRNLKGANSALLFGPTTSGPLGPAIAPDSKFRWSDEFVVYPLGNCSAVRSAGLIYAWIRNGFQLSNPMLIQHVGDVSIVEPRRGELRDGNVRFW